MSSPPTVSPLMRTSDPFSSPITLHAFASSSLSFVCPKAHSVSFCPQLETLILALVESQLLLDVVEKRGGTAQPNSGDPRLGISC